MGIVACACTQKQPDSTRGRVLSYHLTTDCINRGWGISFCSGKGNGEMHPSNLEPGQENASTLGGQVSQLFV